MRNRSFGARTLEVYLATTIGTVVGLPATITVGWIVSTAGAPTWAWVMAGVVTNFIAASLFAEHTLARERTPFGVPLDENLCRSVLWAADYAYGPDWRKWADAPPGPLLPGRLSRALLALEDHVDEWEARRAG